MNQICDCGNDAGEMTLDCDDKVHYIDSYCVIVHAHCPDCGWQGKIHAGCEGWELLEV
jgi:hypothetical protein